ncbi:hypothetical protein RCH10_000770 [Variovorax sp. GrIS 2.14]|uniref:hypothetical protein n=1 Tax=Variovorax sp. GrIS 2.14 TaxID=3071709 RepID=UPI0038F6519A
MQIHAYRRLEAVSINLFDQEIAFKPNTLGHVVSGDVVDTRVVDRLLSISEAFLEYTGKGVEVGVALAVAAAALPLAPVITTIDEGDGDKVFDLVLLGSDSLPSIITIGEGVTITLGDLVQMAFERSDMNREEWNLNDQDDREGLLDTEVTLAIVAHEAIVQAAIDAAAASAAALPPVPVAVVPVINSLVLEATDGEKVDLGAMSEVKLRAFALEAGVTLPKGKGTKVAALRQMVADALTGPAK